ncbi:hypothetical protein [Moorena producens]|uniref:hypothetical protein n=1 Tax=Moorena producens TaxID=1155739 RepID=UPI003C743BCC
MAFTPPISTFVCRYIISSPDSRFPIPDSRFPIPDSRFPKPYTLLPTPYSLLLTTNFPAK